MIRATTRQELDQQTNDTRARYEDTLADAEKRGDSDRAEQLCGHIFTGVGRTVEQHVKLRGNTVAIEEVFQSWVFGEYWSQHARSLSKVSRRMLLSGEYVWQEYVQKEIVETVRRVTIGDRRQPGVLPWIVEHLEPLD